MKQFDHITLLTRKLDSGLNQAEQAQLDEWLAASSDNVAELDIIDKIWQDSTSYEPKIEFDSTAAFQKFKTNNITSDPIVQNSANVGSVTSFLPYAIGALLFLGLGALLFNMTSNDSSNNGDKTIENVVLDSGAKVWLDEDSKIDQTSDDSYTLDGKVFIDGTDNKANLSIDVGNQVISSFGSAYTVNTNQPDLIQIDVESGSVEVATNNGNKLNVVAGKRLEILPDGTYAQYDLKTSNSFTWATRTLEFNNTPLDIVFQDLESYYGIKILNPSLDLSNCYFTSPKLSNTQLDVVLEILNQSHKTEFTVNNSNTYVLSKLDCN